jgi:hypothetical protein
MDNASGTITPGRTNTAAIATTTESTIVAAPASGSQRNVKHLSIFNDHASATATVDVQHTDGTNKLSLCKASLLFGERVVFDQEGDWTHFDSNGAPYPAVGNAATQADMEAGTATNKYATPQGVNWHPGVAKAWVIAGVTGNILASWNITSLTDTGTGILGITIATDFSSVNYCVNVSVEATATTWAVANTRECHIRNATLAAGTVSVDCVDNTATTSLVKDPTTWHVVMYGDQA